MLIQSPGSNQATVTPPQPEGTTTHTVQPGETLTQLAARYGVSEQQILAANPQLRSPNDLGAGQQINIPILDNGGQEPEQVPVHPGQSLTQIGASHGVSVQQLVNANGIRNPNQIRAGQHLWIPVQGNAGRSGANPGVNPFQPQMSKVDAAVKQYQAAKGPQQQASASARISQAVATEIHARAQAELPAGHAPSDALIGSYASAIAQRYANAPAIAQAIQQGASDARAAVAVTSGNTHDPSAAGAVRESPPTAGAEVQAQSGTQAIFKAAAEQAMEPLSQAQHIKQDLDLYQIPALSQSLRRLDQTTAKLDPALAAGVINQALPAIEHFNSEYAKQNGGMGIADDPLHAGLMVGTVMNLSGHIAGTAQGDQDVAQLAKLGFWNNTAVSSALAQGASAAYPEAVARTMIASGQNPIDVVTLIQQGTLADQSIVKSDLQALGAHNQELNWLMTNLGGSMSPEQLQNAVEKYVNSNGWSATNTELTQKVIADAATLTQNLKSLTSLQQADPKDTADLHIDNTVKSIYGDEATRYALTLAASSNPDLYTDAKGGSLLSTLQELKLGDQARKTAQLIGSLAVRRMVTRSLDAVDWKGPNPLGQARAAIGELDSPWLRNWMGVNDETVWNSAVKIVQKNLASDTDTPQQVEQKLATMNSQLNNLKALSADTVPGQLLRSLAVAYAADSTINDAQKFAAAEDAPDKWINGLETFGAFAGFSQKVANLSKGMGLVDARSLMGTFAKDTANGTISIFSGALDVFEGLRQANGWLGEKADPTAGTLTSLGGVGGVMYGLSQLSELGLFDGVAAWGGLGVSGGTLAAGLGLAGVGLVAASVIGGALYQQAKADHQYQGAAQTFLQNGGYTPQAAQALAPQAGLLSGAGGVSGVAILSRYAELKHLSTSQLQHWVGSLTPAQLHQLDQSLLQAAGDSNGNRENFTSGPAQSAVIADPTSGWATMVPLHNTVGVFESTLRSEGVPLPP